MINITHNHNYLLRVFAIVLKSKRKTIMFHRTIFPSVSFRANVIDRDGAWHEKIFTIASNGITVRDVTLERSLERNPCDT